VYLGEKVKGKKECFGMRKEESFVLKIVPNTERTNPQRVQNVI
jgi:hypothetical protein